jgi:hypothetical protein
MRSGQEILAVLQAHKDVLQHRFPAEKGTGHLLRRKWLISWRGDFNSWWAGHKAGMR